MTSETPEPPAPFALKDCALMAMGTGLAVQNLREFRRALEEADPASLYHHFWGRLMQARFDEPEYSNDFASWANHGLHEKALAERLSAVDPTEFPTIEDLRAEILEIVDLRLDESELIPWARADQQFHFLCSQIVVFDTGRVIDTPRLLAEAVPGFSPGSVFYHLIDARRRTPHRGDDFSTWIRAFDGGYEGLAAVFESVDPYFSSLLETRNLLAKQAGTFFLER